MWLCVAHSHDEVNDVVKNTMSLLNLNESTRIRITDIHKELNIWRAILRDSQFLKMDFNRAVNIRGKYLDESMNDLMGELKSKRVHCFECASHTPLQSIRYENLQVICNDIMEEI